MIVQNNTIAEKVSVIIPTHNRLHILKRAIDSVLEQQYPVHEIIVIDDGSTDDTANWLKQQGASLDFIVQDNHGVSHARNRGIENSTGTWIALLDSDDYWHKDKLARQMQALTQQTNSRLCHCDETWIRNGKRLNQKFKHQKYGGYIFEHCLPLCAISPSASIMHRDLFSQYGMFDETLMACEDYDLWLRLTAHEPVIYIDEPLLIKTGGHDDQLSQRYKVMDSFRLQALAGVIRYGKLDSVQRQLAYQIFLQKHEIVSAGAQKHANHALLQDLANRYADLL